MSNDNFSTNDLKKIIIIPNPSPTKTQVDKGNLFTSKKDEFTISLKMKNKDNNNNLSQKEIDNTKNIITNQNLSEISEKFSEKKNEIDNKKNFINNIINNNETASGIENNEINENEVIFPKNLKLNTEPTFANERKYLNSNDNFLISIKENTKSSERSSLKVMVEEKTTKEKNNEKFDSIFSTNKKTFPSPNKPKNPVEKNEYIAISPKSEKIYKKCFICEYLFLTEKLCFAECHKHCLCKKCAKNFYEDAIEDGQKILKCPSLKCQSQMNLKKLKKILSADHYSLVKSKTRNKAGSIYNAKLKTNIKMEDLKLYTQKHVLDINNNQTFFNYNKRRKLFCPNCEQESLYSKTGTLFLKCLNCNQKICKYCLKNYHENHMNINIEDHCKVYFRRNNIYDNKLNTCKNFCLQLFFVIAAYYLTFVGILLSLFIEFKKLFCVKRKNDKITIGIILKTLLALFFSVIIFFISVPFIVLILPYFPVILTISDI